MRVQIEVKSVDIFQKSIRGKDGKDYVIREQVGWLDVGEDYPQKLRIPLEQGANAHMPGMYAIDPKCLYIDRFGRLCLGRLRLVLAA